ncbi:LLM class F420-dependent oxidoreductase [Nocardia sp. NPDC052254]|uniref:LLM class F420-dependent oxidoreductase n=1 Tax=Nocardia sp. NPDC052254 TaxID=3155681 RepID=UPI0034413EF9
MSEQKMKVGISSPILALAGDRPAWEAQAGTAEIISVATTADRLGFDFMTCGEHVAVPPGLPRGERFYDPLATFSFLAGQTNRLKFLPFVLVLPFHHPLEIAKRYGTLDALSDGRLILGFGVGNLKDEFDMLDIPFADRGPRADDALKALRCALGKRVVSYRGPYYSFENMVIDPHSVQAPVPLWIGGHSSRALRRAVTLGDGWAPAPQTFGGPTPEQMREMLDRLAPADDFDVIFTAPEPLDPLTRPDEVAETIASARRAGGTRIKLVLQHRSLSHYLEQLECFAELAGLDGLPA